MAKKKVTIFSEEDLHVKVVRGEKRGLADHLLIKKSGVNIPEITEDQYGLLFSPFLGQDFREARDLVLHSEDPLSAWRGIKTCPACGMGLGPEGLGEPERFFYYNCYSCSERDFTALEILSRWVYQEAQKRGPQIYVLSAQIVPIRDSPKEGAIIKINNSFSPDEAKKLLRGRFISAVGHQATAEALSSLLGINVPAERREIFLRPGDEAVQFVLNRRVEEGRILNLSEIKEVGYKLAHVQRIV